MCPRETRELCRADLEWLGAFFTVQPSENGHIRPRNQFLEPKMFFSHNSEFTDGMRCAGLAGGEVPPCGGDLPQPVLQQPAQHRHQSRPRGTAQR